MVKYRVKFVKDSIIMWSPWTPNARGAELLYESMLLSSGYTDVELEECKEAYAVNTAGI